MDEKELPLQVFESTADVDEKGEIIVKLFKSTCQIETEESERNSLDTISSVSDATEKKISSRLLNLIHFSEILPKKMLKFDQNSGSPFPNSCFCKSNAQR